MVHPGRRLFATLAGAAFAAAVLVVVARATGQGGRAFAALRHLDTTQIALAVLCQCCVYGCVAGILSRGLTGSSASRPAPGYLLYASFAFLFANRALPGPAVAGLATLTVLLKRRGISPADSQAAAATFYLADYVSFAVLGIISVTAVATRLPSAVLRLVQIAAAIVVLSLAGVVMATVRMRRSGPDALRNRLSRATESRHRVVSRIAGIALDGIGQFGTRWSEVARHPTAVATACGLGLVMHVLEALTVLLVARAAKADPGPLAAAAAYVTANLAAIVSLLPGGAGFYEAAMVATLCAAGRITAGPAIAAVAVYRLLSLWLPAPSLLGVVAQALGSVRENSDVRLWSEVDDADR